MEFVKENLITIVLASLLMIIFTASGIFLYKIITKNNSEDDVAISEIKGTIANDIIDENEENNSNNTNVKENTNNVEKNDTRLDKITNIYNSSNAAEEMRLRGYTLNATTLQDGITVFSTGEGLTFYIKFVLNNNILSTKIIYNQTLPETSVAEIMLAMILVDSVGQMKGLPERALIEDLLSNEDAINYTIENNGVEIKEVDNQQGVEIKVDLNSDFSFLNI